MRSLSKRWHIYKKFKNMHRDARKTIFYYITHLSVLIKIYFKYETKIRHVPKASPQNLKHFIEYTQETTGLVKRAWNWESNKPDSDPGSTICYFTHRYLPPYITGRIEWDSIHATYLAQNLVISRCSVNADDYSFSPLHTELLTMLHFVLHYFHLPLSLPLWAPAQSLMFRSHIPTFTKSSPTLQKVHGSLFCAPTQP